MQWVTVTLVVKSSLLTSALSASAGGHVASAIVDFGSGLVAGQIITDVVDYTFGNVKSGDVLDMQPAGNTSFNASCFQLITTTVMSSNVPGINAGTTNNLELTATGGAGNAAEIVMSYNFKVLCTSVATTSNPYALQLSGNQQKYTGNYATIPSGVSKFMVSPSQLDFANGKTNQQILALTSNLSAPLNWVTTITYSGGATDWLKLSVNQGTLLPANQSQLIVTTDNANLHDGSYAAIINFTNINDALQQETVAVNLIVGNSYSYYLPFLANNFQGFTSQVVMQNMGGGAATVKTQYYGVNGNSLSVQGAACSSLAPKASCNVANPFSSGARGTGVVVSNQPLNVLVVESTGYGGSAYSVGSGANSSLIAPLAINNNGGFVTQLTVANVSPNATTATVTFYDQNGNALPSATKTLNLLAHSSQVLDQATAESNLPAGFYGWARVDGTNGSQLVAQIVETRADLKFVAIANAQSAPLNTLYAPAMFNNAYGGFFTGANIVNPNSTPVTVNVSYYDLSGTRFTAAPFVVVGHGVQGVFQGGASGNGIPAGGLPANFVGAAVITSSGGGVNMVVNEFKQVTSGSKSGVYAAASGGSGNLGLPVIARNGFGYTTGTTVFNASNISATFTLTYYNLNGTALTTPAPRSITVGGYASMGVYQGDDLPGDFYGTAVLTQTSGGSTLIDTTNAINSSVGLFYTYTEPAQ